MRLKDDSLSEVGHPQNKSTIKNHFTFAQILKTAYHCWSYTVTNQPNLFAERQIKRRTRKWGEFRETGESIYQLQPVS